VVTRGKASAGSALARRIGAWSTDPVKGIPVLLLVLAAAYFFVGVFGAKTLVDFLENTVFYDHVVPWTEALLRFVVPAGAVQEFLVGPPGLPFRETGGFIIGRYGLVSMGLAYGMAIVLPIVATFFLSFSVLEDSGYLPRLAVMVNRVFKWMGLNGKAVLPMVLGLGCDTMATMTARIMETRKERVIVTLLLALAVPCSAQIAVIFAMLQGLSFAASLWFSAVIVLVLFLVGWLAARVIPGRGSDFVLGTLLLWVLDRTHMLGLVERAASPVVVDILQLPEQAASAFILGFLRRDYAAAGLFQIYQPYLSTGTMTRVMEIQVTVALVTVTLFIPCIANFFMILKERGWRTGLAIAAFVLPFSVGVGAAVNLLMRRFY
jgi:ferrous iron transport protein B